MNFLRTILIIILFLSAQENFAQKIKSDANIIGHVTCSHCEKHIPFATVSIKGTSIGTTTDETGHYQLINLPEGTLIIIAQYLGYKAKEVIVNISANETIEVNFELEPDIVGLEEIVVTGDRNKRNRTDASTIVNTLTPKLFATTQSVTLSDGLNFSPGLRMENNCQNCGFSQVRMNGMEGQYSQILINNRPIFHGLAGVYGLELIPSNMIERVEIIRGGGSAIYGSNAIAGTINLVLKDPINNTYEFGLNSGLTGIGLDGSGKPANDNSVNFNGSIVSSNNKTGMALYGFYRDRSPFDANNDSFSELASLNNVTIGSRIFHRFGKRNKFIVDFFHINETRRGGDKHDYPPHEAGIAEAIKHNITTGALTYEQFFRETDLFSIYVSSQGVNRDSYYGANQSLNSYGNTKELTYSIGTQYSANFSMSSLVLGIENWGSGLLDQKLGYPDIDNAIIENNIIISIPHTENLIIADQKQNTTSLFGQYDISWNKFKISAGARFDHYTIKDSENPDTDNSGNVLSPRLNFKYNIQKDFQARLSYSMGYRAPQIFDEDLHIETSGSRQVIHINAPDLTQETSHSIMASLDYNKQFNKLSLGILIEGFYTKLNNPFANEYSEPDENGTVIYTRVNAENGAIVQGVNFEINMIPSTSFSVTGGFTVQTSQYEEPQEFDEKSFFRTPNTYGYFILDWEPDNKWGLSATGNYTGKMLVPYFGIQIDNPEEGILRQSNTFFDLGLKVRYDIVLNGATLQLFTGVKNIFNSYQNDFDIGIDRDPGYVYGPMEPRTIYFGLKIGNFLK